MIRIAVCEDEPLAMQALADKIQSYMDAKKREHTVSKFLDGESLLSNIARSHNPYDAIYLDIKMNRINGIDTAKEIRKTDRNTSIVFVSALKEYVFDAFEVKASNFLLKPIDDKKLYSTLDNIFMEADTFEIQTLVIRSAFEVVKIPFQNITYCEILNHRLFVYESDYMHECAGKIELLETELNDDFFRCHRSYVVNLRFVERYTDGYVYLISKEKLPVATRRRQAFMQALLRFQRKEVR